MVLNQLEKNLLLNYSESEIVNLDTGNMSIKNQNKIILAQLDWENPDDSSLFKTESNFDIILASGSCNFVF